jgi:Flp pilus assembly protein TadG
VSADRIGRAPTRLFRHRGGATAVEFAMVLPVFVAMVFCVVQFGWAQHCNSSLRFALEKASRALLLDPTLTQPALQTMVQNTLQGMADPNVTVNLQINTTGGSKVANLTGVYSTTLGVPSLASFPISYSTTVSTPLP